MVSVSSGMGAGAGSAAVAAEAHVEHRALAPLGGDEAQQVHASDDAGDHGDSAVAAARVRPLLRAHQREVVAVEPARQLLERGVEAHLWGRERGEEYSHKKSQHN